MKMEDVCDRLDQTVLDIFQVLEDLYAAKSKLEETMKEGFFQMSRCRYSIGVKRVSADQIIDADISCTRCVSLSKDAEDTLKNQDKESQRSDCKVNLFKLECKQNATQESKKDAGVMRDKDQNTELRKRGKKKEDSEASSGLSVTTSDADKSKEDEDQENKFVLTNPINLFGVLVPQSLKSSQKNFESAVSLSVDIANLQAQLSFLQKKYSSLQEKKKELDIKKS